MGRTFTGERVCLKFLPKCIFANVWSILPYFCLYNKFALFSESRHLNTEGSWRYTGELAATCADDSTCLRYGTRGYIIKHNAALMLVKHAR